MQNLIGSTLVAVSLVTVLALATAQRAGAQHGGMGGGKHELGVDLSAAYSHEGSGCTTDCGSFGLGTPVDVRIGFMSSGPLSFEPRFTFTYTTGGGTHALLFTPDVNAMYRLGKSTGREGPYATGGLGLDISNASIGGFSSTATQFSLNVGVGDRIPYESGAWRPEVFFRYNFENSRKGLPSSYNIGVRFGLSLWH